MKNAKSLIKKIINIKNHKIEDFENIITEEDLLIYLDKNKINRDTPMDAQNLLVACPIEFYVKQNSQEDSTTIIIDINGLLIAYNNGEKGNLGYLKN